MNAAVPQGSLLAREWFTAAEIAKLALPEMPATKRGVNALAKRDGWMERRFTNGEPMHRPAKPGGFEYHYGHFPAAAQRELVRRESLRQKAGPAPQTGQNGRDTRSAEAWAWFGRLPEKRKAKAEARLVALDAVETLVTGGLRVNDAVHTAARQAGCSAASIYTWRNLVAGLARADWLPALAPRHVGKTDTASCDPMAWEFLKGFWLTSSRPSFEAAYLHLREAAREHGWSIPSARTLRRRLQAEIPRAVQVLKRDGADAAKRLFPAQERDRTSFHALEAVNADGNRADVFVAWPGEKTPMRPVLLAIQDLYSNQIVGWRIGRTESAHLVQLAFGDVFRDFGIPDYAWLDNGRGFASKWITGQQPTRNRFKIKPADPAGVLTQLGVQVHWATPYSGQSKPIERAFRDLCDHLWRHPAFVGAYTGNKPDAKPEDYGSRAVPLDQFLKIVAQGIALYNTREGRRTRTCGGTLSFQQAFNESYQRAPIKKARDEHVRMCLLAAESVTARQPAGSVHVMGNRYWADFLVEQVGRKLIVRFDPDNLHDGVHVERLDGARLGFAPCFEAAGFADLDAARTHTKARRQWLRGWREMAAAEITINAADVAALVPAIEPDPAPEPSVLRPFFGSAMPKEAAQQDEEFDFDQAFSKGLKGLQLVDQGSGFDAGEE